MRTFSKTIVLGVLILPLLLACGTTRSGVQSRPEKTSQGQISNPYSRPETTREIMVWANGATVEATRTSAFRQAVERICGVYLDATTLSRNRQIVEDNILRVANGFVAGYEVIEEQNTGNGYRGHYLVRVRVSPIIGEMASRIENSMVVDASNIVASVNSQLERNRALVEALSRLLQDYPQQAITTTPVGFGLANEVGVGNTVDVYIDIAVEWNQLWLYRLTRLLAHAETPNTPLAFYWVNSYNDPISYRSNVISGHPGVPANWLPDISMLNTYSSPVVFDINTQNVHLPAAVLESIARNISRRQPIVKTTFLVDGVSASQFSRKLPAAGIQLVSVLEFGPGSAPRAGNPAWTAARQLYQNVFSSGGNANTILLSTPQNQAMGLGRTYRVKVQVPVALVSSFSEIRTSVTY